MKPSNCANIKMEPRQRAATLYLKGALAGGLLLALLAVTLGEHTAAAAASPVVASKSDRPREAAPANTSGGPSSSSSLSSSSSSRSADDQLALPSSTTTTTTSKRLVPISHKETVSTASTRSSTRSSDLSVGQSNLAHAKVHSSLQDMQTAAGHHYGGGGGKGHGKFYMYAESPKKGAYKAGFSRGNHKHMIERKEYQHKSHAGGHMKWHDKKGKGSHKWEFKHYDKKGKHHYG